QQQHVEDAGAVEVVRDEVGELGDHEHEYEVEEQLERRDAHGRLGGHDHKLCGTPVVDLLGDVQVDERLGGRHALDRPDLVQHRQQVLVVAADELGHQVERAGRDHQVVDLVERGQLVGGRAEVTGR